MTKIHFSADPAEKSLQEKFPATDNSLILSINEEDENGSYQADEDQRLFEQDEELSLFNLEF